MNPAETAVADRAATDQVVASYAHDRLTVAPPEQVAGQIPLARAIAADLAAEFGPAAGEEAGRVLVSASVRLTAAYLGQLDPAGGDPPCLSVLATLTLAGRTGEFLLHPDPEEGGT